jgi:toxin ParE1/3/4
MGTPVVFTRSALGDLENIVKYIRLDNPDRAHAFGHLLIDRALALGNFPEMGRVVPEERDPGLREIVQGSYRIVYRIKRDPNRIVVLRFWHGARGTPQIPDSDE